MSPLHFPYFNFVFVHYLYSMSKARLCLPRHGVVLCKSTGTTLLYLLQKTYSFHFLILVQNYPLTSTSKTRSPPLQNFPSLYCTHTLTEIVYFHSTSYWPNSTNNFHYISLKMTTEWS